mgnify:FL=1
MPDPEPILTAAEVREKAARYMALPDTEYPDSDIDDLVSEFREVFIDYRGVAPTPTETTEVVTSRTSKLILRWPEVTTLTSVTVNGTELDADTLTLDSSTGIVTYSGSFSPSYPATVVYVHGLAVVPGILQRATVRYVCAVLKSEASGTGRDVLTQNIDGATTRYSTPDKAAGRPTGWLEVDRLLNSLTDYRVPGIA